MKSTDNHEESDKQKGEGLDESIDASTAVSGGAVVAAVVVVTLPMG